jgi:hypothetical protein
MKIGQAIDQFILFTLLTHRSKAARFYHEHLQGFSRYAGDLDISGLGYELVRGYVRSQLDLGEYFPRDQFLALKKFYAWCKRQGFSPFPAPEIKWHGHPMLKQ